jgi:DNA-binding MarR family transcriptional regulator
LTNIILYSTIPYRGDAVIDKTRGGFLISKIKQVQGRVFERLLIENNITEIGSAQGRILFVLWDEDDIPITELSEKTGLAKTTLTSMLDRLEASDHIKRERDSVNRKIVRIVLTKNAKKLKSRYDEVSVQMSEIFYRGFSDNEIKKFEKALDKVLNNLKEV